MLLYGTLIWTDIGSTDSNTYSFGLLYVSTIEIVVLFTYMIIRTELFMYVTYFVCKLT